MEWEIFFNDLSSFLQYLSGQEHEATLQNLYWRRSAVILKNMEDINARWTLIEAGIKRVYAPRISDGSRGRPKVIIEPEKIQFLRELNFTWTKIADIFGVSRRTLYNIRSEFGMVDEQRFVRISDHDLCYLVERICLRSVTT